MASAYPESGNIEFGSPLKKRSIDITGIEKLIRIPCAHCGRELTPRIRNCPEFDWIEVMFECFDREGRMVREAHRVVSRYENPGEVISRIQPFRSLAEKDPYRTPKPAPPARELDIRDIFGDPFRPKPEPEPKPEPRPKLPRRMLETDGRRRIIL